MIVADRNDSTASIMTSVPPRFLERCAARVRRDGRKSGQGRFLGRIWWRPALHIVRLKDIRAGGEKWILPHGQLALNLVPEYGPAYIYSVRDFSAGPKNQIAFKAQTALGVWLKNGAKRATQIRVDSNVRDESPTPRRSAASS